MKILFLIRSLEIGGAERQLVLTANGLARRGHDVSVAVFYCVGELIGELEHSIKLIDLDKRGRYQFFSFIIRFIKTIRRSSAEILVCSLPAACLVGLTSYLSWRRPKLVWRIAVSWMKLDDLKLLDRLSYTFQSFFSFMPDSIIFNSNAGIELAPQLGYRLNKAGVIFNGIDTTRFMVGLSDERSENTTVGIIGRIDPVKNHKLFLDAAKILYQYNPQSKFYIAGPGDDENVGWLNGYIKYCGLEDVVQYLPNTDVVTFYQRLDVCVLTSLAEGFPNVLGEAMASGVPCVSTDVGDARVIVGNYGRVVDSNSASDVAKSIQRILDLNSKDYQVLSVSAREHICENFSLNQSLNAWDKLLESIRR